MTITKAPKEDAGCWVDGHWGQYGVARVIAIAVGWGWEDGEADALADQHLASMGPSTTEPLDADQFECMVSAADEAEAWLNDHVAAEGMSFGWQDGEFFYMPVTWWAEGEEGDEF